MRRKRSFFLRGDDESQSRAISALGDLTGAPAINSWLPHLSEHSKALTGPRIPGGNNPFIIADLAGFGKANDQQANDQRRTGPCRLGPSLSDPLSMYKSSVTQRDCSCRESKGPYRRPNLMEAIGVLRLARPTTAALAQHDSDIRATMKYQSN